MGRLQQRKTARCAGVGQFAVVFRMRLSDCTALPLRAVAVPARQLPAPVDVQLKP